MWTIHEIVVSLVVKTLSVIFDPNVPEAEGAEDELATFVLFQGEKQSNYIMHC